jgi:nitroimidazol reductase NimA-like FMN-containing flavoprotein (pyridoxamine 5'-phosphate oxidase superfamily)
VTPVAVARAADMDSSECWMHLRRGRLGRLAWGYGPSIDVVPLSYVTDGRALFLPVTPDSRRGVLTTSPWVVFQVDGPAGQATWSVTVRGTIRRVTSLSDLEEVAMLRAPSASQELPSQFVRLDVTSVTGRTGLVHP